MENLKSSLFSEIPKLRELGHKLVLKEISPLEFKGTSGGMGVYAQRGAENFMIRLRIPSGIMNLDTLKLVYKLAKNQNLEKVHLTTRQAIQLHDLSIDSVCDVMEEALHNDLYTRGGGGNFPRNVSISPLSGVDVEEEFDVTPYAMAVNKHFMNKITTYKLPRKLKVSFSSSKQDTGNSSIADLGFMAIKEGSKEFFKVYIAGGLGKNGAKAVEFDELIDTKDILYHVEAMTNLFIAEGDYENKNKARSRYIVARMGEEEFKKCYKKHLKDARSKENLDLNVNKKEYKKEGINIDLKDNRLIPQKQDGLYSIYFHPVCGQLSLETLKVIIDKLDNVEDVEVRLSMSEGMYIRNLNGNEAKEVLELTRGIGGETKLEQSVACIGVPTCQIGICESQSTLEEILSYFKEKSFNKDILPTLHISGCNNSCGTHQIGMLGFAGKKKRVDGVAQEAFELHIGGRKGNNNTTLGKICGDIARKDVPKFLYDLAVAIDISNKDYNSFIENNEEDLNLIIEKYLA